MKVGSRDKADAKGGVTPGTGFPPYSYVPGGPWPHPKSHPEGHAHHIIETPAPAMDPDRWRESRVYMEGVRLFDAGYYWEAHEAWERLWHSAGRKGPVADFLKALIKMAAAGVKLREGIISGASTHAGRAEAMFRELNRQVGPEYLGQNLETLAERACSTKSEPARISDELRALPVHVVFDWRLEPT
jgi:hypothetical protein